MTKALALNDLPSLAQAYLGAWQAMDARALGQCFAPGGTYEDPGTGGPLPAAQAGERLAFWASTFPDVAWEWRSWVGSSTAMAVEWVATGHNGGAFLPGMAPTLQAMRLEGVTLLEGDASGLRSVRTYFDHKAWVEGFGLMALIQPIEQGPAQFGYSMRVATNNPKPPGIIALTWIQGANEDEKARIRAHARQNVQDFLAEPGFISIITGFTGLRGFTVTAWEDEASMKSALSKHHAVAMRELFQDNFVASVWTSVWQPTRLNRLWVRCTVCGSLEDASSDPKACSQCAAELPPRPAFW